MPFTAERRHPRIEVYVGAQCSVFSPGTPQTCLEGKTQSVSPGGARLLLPTRLPLHTRLVLRLGDGAEIRGKVVWTDKVIRTDLGRVMGHGIAFTRDLDASILTQILSGIQRQRHSRVHSRFPVEYTDLEKSGAGTCLNVSQGGMFIATVDTFGAGNGEDLLVHVTLPGLPNMLSLWSRVVWTNPPGSPNSFPAGMGIRFVKMEATEARHLATFLERSQTKAAPLDPVSP